MAKHSGCFVCGQGIGQILTSIPDFKAMSSVALCPTCHALSSDDLRRKIDNIRNAMQKAREAAANG